MWTRLAHRTNVVARQRAYRYHDLRRTYQFSRRYAHVIGIDLGTTNSCVSVVEGEGQEAKIIENADGARTTPSVVSLNNIAEAVVGVPAKRQAQTQPLTTYYATKRLLGKSYDDIDLQADSPNFGYKLVKGDNGEALVDNNGTALKPQQISAYILLKMKETAEMYLGESVTDCVIGVPAYFDEVQRQATHDAAAIAGLNVKELINEPTAAAIAYGLEAKEDGKVLVYDLGGGTFDVSVLKSENGTFEVLGTSGNNYLGGEDFDNAIVEYLKDLFYKETKITLDEPLAIQRVREAAENAKMELTVRQGSEVSLPFISADATGPKHLNTNLTRAMLEQMCTPFINATLDPCDAALAQAGLTAEDIDKIVLVGGMAKMPKIQQVIREKFGKDPVRSVSGDEVVAAGAAHVGFGYSGNKKLQVIDTCNLSIGVETLGGLFYRVVEKGSSLPCTKKFTFTTAVEQQNQATIKVFQGERELVKHNTLLGEVLLENLDQLPRGQLKINVKIRVDKQGIVTVRHNESREGEPEHEATFESVCAMSEEEIEKLIAEASETFVTESQYREHQQIVNSADQTIWSTEFLLENCEDISEDIQSKAQGLIQTVKGLKLGKQYEKLQKQTENLEKIITGIHADLKKKEEAQIKKEKEAAAEEAKAKAAKEVEKDAKKAQEEKAKYDEEMKKYKSQQTKEEQ